MIRSARDPRVWTLLEGRTPRRFPTDLARPAMRRLRAVHEAVLLEELRLPPSNRLEALHGDRAGWYSIRINRQWRVCFRWREGAAEDVEIADYH